MPMHSTPITGAWARAAKKKSAFHPKTLSPSISSFIAVEKTRLVTKDDVVLPSLQPYELCQWYPSTWTVGVKSK